MKLTNEFQLPQSFVDVIHNITYDKTTDDLNRIGITTLISPPRIRLLSTRHWKHLEEDVSDSLWRILGSAVHYVLAKTDSSNRLVEEKLIEVVNGITIVAKPDLYEAKEKSISDYKITSVWAVKGDAKKDWIEQLNCYAWILRKAGFPIETAYIHAILRDWRKSEMKRYKTYPPIPFFSIQIDLWSFEAQQQFIESRVALYKSVLELGDTELPLCSQEERWDNDKRCQEYCVCHEFCNYWQENYGK